jgi:hypothetical protein
MSLFMQRILCNGVVDHCLTGEVKFISTSLRNKRLLTWWREGLKRHGLGLFSQKHEYPCRLSVSLSVRCDSVSWTDSSEKGMEDNESRAGTTYELCYCCKKPGGVN